MKFKTLLATLAAASMFVFAGCTVDKTQEGNVPDVDVTTEGELEAPAYDVKPADVDVGTTETNVTVPTVDVNMPPESDVPAAPANSDM